MQHTNRTRVSSISLAVFLILLTYFNSSNVFAEDSVVTLDRDRAPIVGNASVQQSFILTQGPNAQASLILFPGGGGKLRVAANGTLSINANNFLVRNRHLFAAAGYNVATMDAASDFLKKSGGLRDSRRTPEVLSDIAATIAYMRARFPNLPVWLVGTSRGSIAAANAAAMLDPHATGPDGLVLTASVTRPGNSATDSLQDVAINLITQPTLLVHHKSDACYVSPSVDTNSLKNILEINDIDVDAEFFKGGSSPLDSTCSALSTHGFFGLDLDVVTTITDWISAR